jgi:Ubiquinol-cytochrome C chaperone
VFNSVVDLPPDFHIEFAVFNMHMWLITRRLKQFSGKQAELMEKCLTYQFDLFVAQEVNDIHIKKKGDFIQNLKYFKDMNQNLFEKHFFSDPKTSQNPYYKIDALVWSVIYYEKVERYSDQVYLLSEYFIQHYRYLNTLTLEDFMDGQLDFDIYRNSLDYKKKIQLFNKPLTEDELEAELESSNPVKSFYYNYDDPDLEMPIDVERRNIVDHRFDQLGDSLIYTVKKFNTLDTYDFYSDREEREKEEKKKESKYAWKSKNEKAKIEI